MIECYQSNEHHGVTLRAHDKEFGLCHKDDEETLKNTLLLCSQPQDTNPYIEVPVH